MFGKGNGVSLFLARIVAFLPNLFVAVLVLVIAAAVAAAVKDLLSNLLGGLSYGAALANAASLFVVAIGWAGLYIPAALLIAWFMARLGGFSWRAGLLTGVCIAALAFVTFETWFLVPLPKGPVETWFGY